MVFEKYIYSWHDDNIAIFINYAHDTQQKNPWFVLQKYKKATKDGISHCPLAYKYFCYFYVHWLSFDVD
jgi:hypothetical protein